MLIDPNGIREETIQELLAIYRSALETAAIGPDLLAKKRKQQLSAKVVRHINIRGSIPEEIKLPSGYRIISNGGVTRTDKGGMIFHDILIEYKGPDWAIQIKATESLEKILGLYNEKINLSTSAAVQTQLTDFPPEPKSLEEWEEIYHRFVAQKNGTGDTEPTSFGNTTPLGK